MNAGETFDNRNNVTRNALQETCMCRVCVNVGEVIQWFSVWTYFSLPVRRQAGLKRRIQCAVYIYPIEQNIKMAIGDLKTEKGVKDLNAYLAERSYIEGWALLIHEKEIILPHVLHLSASWTWEDPLPLHHVLWTFHIFHFPPFFFPTY